MKLFRQLDNRQTDRRTDLQSYSLSRYRDWKFISRWRVVPNNDVPRLKVCDPATMTWIKLTSKNVDIIKTSIITQNPFLDANTIWLKYPSLQQLSLRYILFTVVKVSLELKKNFFHGPFSKEHPCLGQLSIMRSMFI